MKIQQKWPKLKDIKEINSPKGFVGSNKRYNNLCHPSLGGNGQRTGNVFKEIIRAGAVVSQLRQLPMTAAVHTGAGSMRLPANGLAGTTENYPNAWVLPPMWETWQSSWFLQPSREWVRHRKPLSLWCSLLL